MAEGGVAGRGGAADLGAVNPVTGRREVPINPRDAPRARATVAP